MWAHNQKEWGKWDWGKSGTQHNCLCDRKICVSKRDFVSVGFFICWEPTLERHLLIPVGIVWFSHCRCSVLCNVLHSVLKVFQIMNTSLMHALTYLQVQSSWKRLTRKCCWCIVELSGLYSGESVVHGTRQSNHTIGANMAWWLIW